MTHLAKPRLPASQNEGANQLASWSAEDCAEHTVGVQILVQIQLELCEVWLMCTALSGHCPVSWYRPGVLKDVFIFRDQRPIGPFRPFY